MKYETNCSHANSVARSVYCVAITPVGRVPLSDEVARPQKLKT